MADQVSKIIENPTRKAFAGAIPHNQDLGIEPLEAEGGHALAKLPYDERLVGDPETGVIHGGVVTTLIDTVCGLAVMTALDKPQPIATLDLRIDYLKPAMPKEDLLARAHAYKITRQVVFVRATAYQTDEKQPIANAVGTFMLTGRLGPGAHAGKKR
ncbi:MAG: PaaI family thioesterase [Alphaproteobacteria bacterium]|nr:PaaI family thioesterase [Alphaproteobacteria bacterium]